MASELRDLANLINKEVDTIERLYNESGEQFPSLNDPEAEPFMKNPQVAQSSFLAIAAASRLIASLQTPFSALYETAAAMYNSACLGVVAEASVAEALTIAGPQGMHIRDLASKVGMDPVKLGQGLRSLCAMRHIFKEVSPDVFAHNRLSVALDTKKGFEDVKDRNPHRYDNAEGYASLITHITDIGLKGASEFTTVLLDPATAFSHDPTKTTSMKGAGFDGAVWDWLEQPGNEHRFLRFATVMRGAAQFYSKDFVLKAYDWDSLARGALVVDVGGGAGSLVQSLAKPFSSLRYIIQDRAAVIADGEKFWKGTLPEALESGLVKFQAHNFFDPQPIKDASIFVLRFVLHDWGNDKAKEILQHLRNAATVNTKLIVIEQVIPYACPENMQTLSAFTDTNQVKLPEILSGVSGPAGAFPYIADLHMLDAFNAQERTPGQWVDLLNSAGWGISSVRPGFPASIICTPV